MNAVRPRSPRLDGRAARTVAVAESLRSRRPVSRRGRRQLGTCWITGTQACATIEHVGTFLTQRTFDIRQRASSSAVRVTRSR